MAAGLASISFADGLVAGLSASAGGGARLASELASAAGLLLPLGEAEGDALGAVLTPLGALALSVGVGVAL